MYQHVYLRLEDKELPSLRKDLDEQSKAMMPRLLQVVED